MCGQVIQEFSIANEVRISAYYARYNVQNNDWSQIFLHGRSITVYFAVELYCHPFMKITYTYLLTYLLTPRNTALLEKLTDFQLVKKFPAFYGTRQFITAFTSTRRLSVWMFHNMIRFYGQELLAPRLTPKLEDHPLSAVRNCLFNIFASTLHIGGRFSTLKPRTRHAVVTYHGEITCMQLNYSGICGCTKL